MSLRIHLTGVRVLRLTRPNAPPIDQGPDSTPPSAPAGFAVGVLTTTTAAVSWTAHANPDGDGEMWLAYVGTTTPLTKNNSTPYLISSTPSATSGTIGNGGVGSSNPALIHSTAYYAALVFADTAGNESDLSNEISFTTTVADSTPPATPTWTVSPVSGETSSRVTLTANRNTEGDMAQYSVFWKKSTDAAYPSTPNQEISHPGSGSTFSFNVTGLVSGTLYNFKLKATDSNGNTSGFSEEINATTLTISGWPDNEPTGMTTLVIAHDGTTKSFPGWTTSAEWDDGLLDDATTLRVEVVQDTTAKYGACIRKRFQIGDDAGFKGKVMKTSMHATGFREMYYRVVFRVSDNFQWHSGAQKLYYCGFKGTSNPTHMMIESDGTIQFKPTYQSGGCTTGTRVFKATGITVSRGEWHTHEYHIVAQSAVGVADGSARFWFDGEELTEWNCVGSSSYCAGLNWVDHTTQFVNMEWQPACAPNHLLSGFEGPLYWGGSGSYAKTVNDHFDLGELYIVGKL